MLEKKPTNLEEIDPTDPKQLEEYYQGLKVSRPENAVHENHIGWDPKKQTFDLSQLSKELKNIFKNAGIRKRDLQDTNTALLIADAILNQPLPEATKKKKKKKTKGKMEPANENMMQVGMNVSQSSIGPRRSIGVKPSEVNLNKK